MNLHGQHDFQALSEYLLFFLVLDAYLEDQAIPQPERPS